MRRFLQLIAATLLLAACSSVDPSDPPTSASNSPQPTPAAQLEALIATNDGEVRLGIEVADSPEERATGLMNRTSLAEDAGMAFLFDQPTGGGFWMKDTLIPLSIAFWDQDGRIVAILDMHPCETVSCPVYEPGATYVGALEVNQGFFDRHEVEVGDTIELRGASYA
jgi:uncharacterized protein